MNTNNDIDRRIHFVVMAIETCARNRYLYKVDALPIELTQKAYKKGMRNFLRYVNP